MSVGADFYRSQTYYCPTNSTKGKIMLIIIIFIIIITFMTNWQVSLVIVYLVCRSIAWILSSSQCLFSSDICASICRATSSAVILLVNSREPACKMRPIRFCSTVRRTMNSWHHESHPIKFSAICWNVAQTAKKTHARLIIIIKSIYIAQSRYKAANAWCQTHNSFIMCLCCPPSLCDIFPTTMAQYSLFELKVPLNTKQTNKQTMSSRLLGGLVY